MRTRVAMALTATTLTTALAGCGGSHHAATPSSGRDSAGALRASLTGVLANDAYLTGIAAQTRVDGGGAAATAAESALTANTDALGKLISAQYGQTAGEQFATLWQSKAQISAAFLAALQDGNRKRTHDAGERFASFTLDVGSLLSEMNADLPANVVSALLTPGMEGLRRSLEMLAGGSPQWMIQLRASADAQDQAAKVFADATARLRPTAFSGTATDRGAELRATLTALLHDHVYLVATLVRQVIEHPDAAKASAIGSGVLADNSGALSRVVKATYGPTAARSFLKLWTTRIDTLLRAARAEANGDDVARAAARRALHANSRRVAELLSGLAGDGQEAALADTLVTTGRQLTKSLAATVTRSPAASVRLRVTAGGTAATADLIARGAAHRYPAKYPGV